MVEDWKPIPISGETVPEVMIINTFVKGLETLVFCDFFETIDHTIVIGIARGLSLKSDFYDFERLHEENLEPS